MSTCMYSNRFIPLGTLLRNAACEPCLHALAIDLAGQQDPDSQQHSLQHIYVLKTTPTMGVTDDVWPTTGSVD